MLLGFVMLMSCEEKNSLPMVTDKVAPGKVEIIGVTPINGGLLVEFNAPSDPDLLLIRGVYELVGGVKAEVQVSYYQNQLKVVGFGNTDERKVTLYAVDRSGNLSEPVEIKGTPLVSPLQLVKDSMSITADFGGARFSWINKNAAPIAIDILAEDSVTHKLIKYRTIYTSATKTSYAIRGLKPIPTLFGAIIRDQWNNATDTIKPAEKRLTPIFEQKLNKKIMKLLLQCASSDTKFDAYGYRTENVFDDDFATIGHSSGDKGYPQIISIDLGVKVRLSRIRIYQRPNDTGPWIYSHGNPKAYDVYGAEELPANPNDLTQWTKLRPTCVSVKPSGDGLAITDEDVIHAKEGDEFDFDQLNKPQTIRYFRIAIKSTWDGAGFINFAEISWWGLIL